MQFVYNAEPTPARFHADDSDVRYIEGPWGSGKTTTCIMELIKLGMEQQPDANNRRRTRWAIIRNTYPELKSTTIKSFQQWVPHTIAPIVFSVPITSKFVQRMPDGTVVDIEFVFMALDGPEDVGKLLSLELTGAYANEGREMPWEVIEAVVGRTGRYPETIKDAEGKTTFGPTHSCLLIDSNPPRTSHFLYTMFVEGDVRVTEVKKGDKVLRVKWTKFTQPPAVFKNEVTGTWELNPDAENLSHLEDNYYVRQMALGDEHIRVNLAGEPGMTRKGTAIFQKYSKHKHVAKQILMPKRGTSILLGIDFGLTPAVVVGQLGYKGLTLLDELPATDESLEDFLDEQILPLIRSKYNGYTVIACGDPAGGARSSINKMTSIGVMRARGIKTYPAITNAFVKRKEAVDWFLGRDEGLQIDPRLTHTIEAFGAGYVWKEIKNSKGLHLDVADKNEFSHIADAVQYLCLYARYGGGQLQRPQSNAGSSQATLGASGEPAGAFKWA
jgi:hypothetical protein